MISVKGDTLNCVDMQGKKQGPWVIRVESLRGEEGYEEEGFFEKDKKEGLWRRYSLVGDLTAMENYRWGNKNGKNIYFNKMGNILREESWKAVNPDNPYDTIPVYDLVDPTKVIGSQVIKLEGLSLKHGLWTFYDPYYGGVERTEKWWLDKPANSLTGGGDDMAPIDISNSDSTAAKKIAVKPKEVLEFEKNNSKKKKIKVREGRTSF
jgi:hypothetical protein